MTDAAEPKERFSAVSHRTARVARHRDAVRRLRRVDADARIGRCARDVAHRPRRVGHDLRHHTRRHDRVVLLPDVRRPVRPPHAVADHRRRFCDCHGGNGLCADEVRVHRVADRGASVPDGPVRSRHHHRRRRIAGAAARHRHHDPHRLRYSGHGGDGENVAVLSAACGCRGQSGARLRNGVRRDHVGLARYRERRRALARVVSDRFVSAVSAAVSRARRARDRALQRDRRRSRAHFDSLPPSARSSARHAG